MYHLALNNTQNSPLGLFGLILWAFRGEASQKYNQPAF